MSSINAPDSRVNVLIRLVGIMFLALGAGMTYLTYREVAAATLVPALIPVLYLLSSMLMVAGFAALMSRYKESGAPRA
jgi:hypothetical protein